MQRDYWAPLRSGRADTCRAVLSQFYGRNGKEKLTRVEGGLGDLVWFVLASNQIRPDGEIELDETCDCDSRCHYSSAQPSMNARDTLVGSFKGWMLDLLSHELYDAVVIHQILSGFLEFIGIKAGSGRLRNVPSYLR
jgi:hypothetical protein